MLNGGLKKEALEALERTHKEYEKQCKTTQEASIKLYELRASSSKGIIPAIEAYINSLANKPKEFDKTFSEYKAEFTIFTNILHELEVEAQKASVKAGGASAAGVAAGVGTAALAPTAAMAIATTFGTASTGTAISALSGAAAANAALAWLGGGALAAGGGGMSAGSALLALAGPVGVIIGSTALVGSGLYMRRQNGKIAEDANKQRKKISTHTATLNAALREIVRIKDLTKSHLDGLDKLFSHLLYKAPRDYAYFNREQREQIGALINHVRSLSKLLNLKIDVK